MGLDLDTLVFGATAFGCAPLALLILSGAPIRWLVRAQMERPCVD